MKVTTSLAKGAISVGVFLAGMAFPQVTAAETDGLTARVVTLEQRVEILEQQLALIREEMRAMLGASRSAEMYASARLSTADVTQGAVQPSNIATPDQRVSGVDAAGDTSNGLGQEMFISRESVPVLRDGSFDLSYEISYGRNSNFITSERSVGMSTALRYGVTNRLEVGARLSGYYSHRETSTIPGAGFVTNNFGIGDSQLSASYLVMQQKRGRPGMSVSAAAIIPGSDPYFFPPGYVRGVAPLNNAVGYQSHGHWGARLNGQFFANADPLVFFWGGGVEYLFDKQKQGYTISRGLRVAASVGVSLALSERTTVANSLQFSYEGKMKVNGTPVFGSDNEHFLTRFTLVQRIGDSTYLEPGFSFGLTDDAQDLLVTLGVRKQW
jgi:hypothetical protein